ncbi:Alpha beta-hydrolase [Rhizoctonia solani]|uniref:Alpha beta-hydrolase n=1 Tax=Rhizoctonia solani TaxID=456999 RepID=A0A8H7IKW2_9AGAM|nr:Alpha beta-hydrolase [Rhizoctonia solani]
MKEEIGHVTLSGYFLFALVQVWRRRRQRTVLVRWMVAFSQFGSGRTSRTDFEKLYAAPPLHCVPRQLTFVDSSWPVITDVTLVQVPTDRFPMCSNEATIHLGFLESHKRSIDSISGAVEDILKEHHGAQVITVGHSLGAALATLDGMYMKQKLGYNVEVITRTFGGPRLLQIASTQTIPDFVRITNKRDPIPILPPVISGYHHPSGEKHINLEGMWHNCAGQENLNKNCSVGEAWVNVPYWFEHDGPYAGGAQTRQDANCVEQRSEGDVVSYPKRGSRYTVCKNEVNSAMAFAGDICYLHPQRFYKPNSLDQARQNA